MNKTSLILIAFCTLAFTLSCEKENPTIPAYDEGVHYYENDVDYGSVVTLDGVTWAPVNCGYSVPKSTKAGTVYFSFPYGKLYQWARNYGQGYSLEYDATVPNVVNAPWEGEIKDADPNTVYYGFTASDPYVSIDRYYWSKKISYKSWNDGSRNKPIKASNDPCPKGWRVPTISELEQLVNGNYSEIVVFNNQRGRWFTGSTKYEPSVGARIFLPLAGYRFTDAKPMNRESIAYYWSSESDSYNRAHYMSFSVTERPHIVSAYGKSTEGAQSISMSVRCVK